MANQQIIAAWKSRAHRSSLSPAARRALPPNPAGAVELRDDLLEHAWGGLVDDIKPLTHECPSVPFSCPPRLVAG